MKRIIVFVFLFSMIFVESEAQKMDKMLKRAVRELRSEGWKSMTDKSIAQQLFDTWKCLGEQDSEHYPVYLVNTSYFNSHSVDTAVDSALYYVRIGAIDTYNSSFYTISDIGGYKEVVNDSSIFDLWNGHIAVNIVTAVDNSISDPFSPVEIIDVTMSGYEPFIDDIQKCERIVLSLWRQKGDIYEVQITTVYPMAEMKCYPVQYDMKFISSSQASLPAPTGEAGIRSCKVGL